MSDALFDDKDEPEFEGRFAHNRNAETLIRAFLRQNAKAVEDNWEHLNARDRKEVSDFLREQCDKKQKIFVLARGALLIAEEPLYNEIFNYEYGDAQPEVTTEPPKMEGEGADEGEGNEDRPRAIGGEIGALFDLVNDMSPVLRKEAPEVIKSIFDAVGPSLLSLALGYLDTLRAVSVHDKEFADIRAKRLRTYRDSLDKYFPDADEDFIQDLVRIEANRGRHFFAQEVDRISKTER